MVKADAPDPVLKAHKGDVVLALLRTDPGQQLAQPVDLARQLVRDHAQRHAAAAGNLRQRTRTMHFVNECSAPQADSRVVVARLAAVSPLQQHRAAAAPDRQPSRTRPLPTTVARRPAQLAPQRAPRAQREPHQAPVLREHVHHPPALLHQHRRQREVPGVGQLLRVPHPHVAVVFALVNGREGVAVEPGGDDEGDGVAPRGRPSGAEAEGLDEGASQLVYGVVHGDGHAGLGAHGRQVVRNSTKVECRWSQGDNLPFARLVRVWLHQRVRSDWQRLRTDGAAPLVSSRSLASH